MILTSRSKGKGSPLMVSSLSRYCIRTNLSYMYVHVKWTDKTRASEILKVDQHTIALQYHSQMWLAKVHVLVRKYLWGCKDWSVSRGYLQYMHKLLLTSLSTQSLRKINSFWGETVELANWSNSPSFSFARPVHSFKSWPAQAFSSDSVECLGFWSFSSCCIAIAITPIALKYWSHSIYAIVIIRIKVRFTDGSLHCCLQAIYMTWAGKH